MNVVHSNPNTLLIGPYYRTGFEFLIGSNCRKHKVKIGFNYSDYHGLIYVYTRVLSPDSLYRRL